MVRRNPISDDLKKRMENSVREARELTSRYLSCPYCGFRTERIFADTAGHIESKCQKCKSQITYKLTPGTLLDFRRVK